MHRGGFIMEGGLPIPPIPPWQRPAEPAGLGGGGDAAWWRVRVTHMTGSCSPNDIFGGKGGGEIVGVSNLEILLKIDEFLFLKTCQCFHLSLSQIRSFLGTVCFQSWTIFRCFCNTTVPRILCKEQTCPAPKKISFKDI